MHFGLRLAQLCALLTALRLASGEIYEECAGVADETFVASSQDCRTYIYCLGEDSMTGECDEGQYFDGESSTCDLEENVYCPFDAPVESEEEPEEPEPVETTAVPTTTEMPTTTASANVTMNPDNGIYLETVVRDVCPSVDDTNLIVVLPNRNTCSDYFLCYHGNAIEMHCTNQLHFNTKTGKCDFPENVKCMVNTIRPHDFKCLPFMTDFFPHPEKCNYFYYCIKGYMTIQQCPFYYGWDIERRSCVQLSQARCYPGARRL